jgi:hypothetical protein
MSEPTREEIRANRARWVVALRSGKYKQGDGSLHTNDAFCCLGVACDLVDPEGWEPSRWNPQEQVLLGTSESEWMPEDMEVSFGINRSQQERLAGRNDCGASFQQLASSIEWIPFPWENPRGEWSRR